MADCTFEDLVSDGDWTNFLAYPGLAIPTSTDNLILAAIPTNNTTTGVTLPCLNLTDSSGTGANYIGGSASATCYGTATTIQVNGGSLLGGVSSTLQASGCIFTTNPGGNVTFDATTTWGNDTFAGNLTATANMLITTGATSIFSGTVVVAGTLVYTTGAGGTSTAQFTGDVTASLIILDDATFTGTVSAASIQNGVFNCPTSCNSVGGGTFSNLIQSGPTVDLNSFYYPLAFTGPVSWTGVTAAENVDCQNVKQSGSTITFLLTGAGGSVSLTQNIPADQYVLAGHGSPGTLTIPAVTFVASPATGGPATYGVAGTGSVGTLTLTGAGNVIHGSGVFGVGGTSITPNYFAPAANTVDSTTTFGVGNATTGGNISNVLATNVVKNGTAYGIGGAKAGTYMGSGGGGSPSVRPGVLG